MSGASAQTPPPQQRAVDADDTPAEVSPDNAHAAEPMAEPVKASEEVHARPGGRMRRTVSWADAQPDKSLGLVAVREFEPRCEAAARCRCRRVRGATLTCCHLRANGARSVRPQRDGGLGGRLRRRTQKKLLRAAMILHRQQSTSWPRRRRLAVARRLRAAVHSCTALLSLRLEVVGCP
jgi:hypothetical protein